ncbi:MAG: hypothetical protein U0746_15825 [Gemmataceae bacterium]
MPRWLKVTASVALLTAIGCSSSTPPAKSTTPEAKPTKDAKHSGDAAPAPKPPPP